MSYDFKTGEILLINKALNWTSFDVAKKIRNLITRATGERGVKVGHAGTLDPLATGLLVVCTGKRTKQIDPIQNGEKEYIATLQLGATTPSFDLETEINEHFAYQHVTEELLRQALTQFTGIIEQTPPAFSAKRINGQRAYDKARNGEKVKMKPAIIEIKHIEILHFAPPILKLRVVSGKGTYIRSLAHDIGKTMHTGAYLSALQRTRIGQFTLTDALTIEELEERAMNQKNIVAEM